MGLVLEDTSSVPLYETFILTKPVTDLYYGLTSDVPQVTLGDWQLSFWPEDSGEIFYFGQQGFQ